MKTSKTFYTKDSLEAIARKFTSLKEFRENNINAYNAAARNGWLDDYVWLARKKSANVKNKRKYTKEEIIEIAKNYPTRNQFAKGNRNLYQYAVNHGFLDEMTWMPKPTYTKKIWTSDKIYKFILQCNSYSEFCKNKNAYNAARYRNILNDIKSIFAQNVEYISREECYEHAKKYISRTLFCRNEFAIYRYAHKKGWIDEWFDDKRGKCKKVPHIFHFVKEIGDEPIENYAYVHSIAYPEIPLELVYSNDIVANKDAIRTSYHQKYGIPTKNISVCSIDFYNKKYKK